MKTLILVCLLFAAGCSHVGVSGRATFPIDHGYVSLGFRDHPEFWWPYDSTHFFRDPFYPVYPISHLRYPIFFGHRPPYHHRIPRYQP